MKKITQKWIEFAKRDLKDAEILFKNKAYQGASWHCHQAIEKILKAIIVEQNKRPQKIHDLVELLKSANIELPEDLMSFIEELDIFYLPSRYPDLYEQVKNIYRVKNIQRIMKLTKILFSWLKNYLNQR